MKKTFQIVGVLTLLLGSFIYNEKVATTSKQTDELLDEIKRKSNRYIIKPKEAQIENNTIIPGINGKVIDIKKTYDNMRQMGYFNDKLIIYKDVFVKNKLKDNLDKYIIAGNLSKKEIALIFKLDENDNLNNILSILDKNNSKGTFFITSNFLEKNHNLVIRLIQNGHVIGNLSKNEDYNDSDFVWMKTIITSTKYQKYNYCLKDKSDKVLEYCKLYSSYTIRPTDIKYHPYISIKKHLKNGTIYKLSLNKATENELELIIKYIQSKGYKIVSLEKLLNESIIKN